MICRRINAWAVAPKNENAGPNPDDTHRYIGILAAMQTILPTAKSLEYICG
jgi:hypothetical protein